MREDMRQDMRIYKVGGRNVLQRLFFLIFFIIEIFYRSFGFFFMVFEKSGGMRNYFLNLDFKYDDI